MEPLTVAGSRVVVGTGTLDRIGTLLEGLVTAHRAAIVTDVHRDAMVVAASVVQISNDKQYVFVLNGDKVKRQQIRTGVDGGDWLEVLAGLSPTDEIVTAGMDVLSDGATVRAVHDVDPFSGKPIAAGTAP